MKIKLLIFIVVLYITFSKTYYLAIFNYKCTFIILICLKFLYLKEDSFYLLLLLS